MSDLFLKKMVNSIHDFFYTKLCVMSVKMKFNPNKTLIEEVIREGAFEGTCFRDIYSGVTGERYRKS